MSNQQNKSVFGSETEVTLIKNLKVRAKWVDFRPRHKKRSRSLVVGRGYYLKDVKTTVHSKNKGKYSVSRIDENENHFIEESDLSMMYKIAITIAKSQGEEYAAKKLEEERINHIVALRTAIAEKNGVQATVKAKAHGDRKRGWCNISVYGKLVWIGNDACKLLQDLIKEYNLEVEELQKPESATIAEVEMYEGEDVDEPDFGDDEDYSEQELAEVAL